MREPTSKPRLRPIEAFRMPGDNEGDIGIRDRSGLSQIILTVSEPVLQIMSLMDGHSTFSEIDEHFDSKYGHPLELATWNTLLDHLDEAHFLEGPSFDKFYRQQQDEFRRRGVRERLDPVQLGAEGDLGSFFEAMFAEAPYTATNGPVRGLIAPHLDYPRGRCCYAAAYSLLRGRPTPDRVVVLGTNHFGRGTSVVATCTDFATPLGRTSSDSEFIHHLESLCGPLCDFELDHGREHSIELQVACLQHLFGGGSFQLAAFLCPDPCGPTGTKPRDGHGVDLDDFAEVLRASIKEDSKDTLIIAGADLSHVGAAFGDERALDEAYLEEVRIHDQQALSHLSVNNPEGLRAYVGERSNATNICSVGCIYTLAKALPTTTATVIRYHQAVDQSTQTCVTCAAVAFS